MTFYTYKKSEADETEKFIKSSLNKKITDTNNAVNTKLSTVLLLQQQFSDSISIASINSDGDVEQPAKK